MPQLRQRRRCSTGITRRFRPRHFGSLAARRLSALGTARPRSRFSTQHLVEPGGHKGRTVDYRGSGQFSGSRLRGVAQTRLQLGTRSCAAACITVSPNWHQSSTLALAPHRCWRAAARGPAGAGSITFMIRHPGWNGRTISDTGSSSPALEHLRPRRSVVVLIGSAL